MSTECYRYHSALKENAKLTMDAEPCKVFRTAHGIAARLDFVRADFEQIIAAQKVDIIYSEAPYPGGIKKFNEAAGIESVYSEIVSKTQQMIDTIAIPIVIIGHAKAFRDIETRKVKLNGHMVTVYVKNIDINIPSSNIVLQSVLAKRYGCVWDMFCGYGNVGMAFARQGKRFFLTDYNAKCIGAFKILYEEEFEG